MSNRRPIQHRRSHISAAAENHRSQFATWRYRTLLVILALLTACLLFRFIELNIVERGFLQKESNARVLRHETIPAFRGMITDRNGEPLAISTPVSSIWINPVDFQASNQQIHQLAGLIHKSVYYINKRAHPNAHREFVYLRRRMSPQVGAAVEKLKIKGVYEQREYKRFYPSGEVDSQLIGFTNIKDHGQEGLELAYDKWLAGSPGKKEVLKDRYGHIISVIAETKTPSQGHVLALAIDQRMQYIAYRELQSTLQKFDAESGSIIVENVKTGEVLAMVNGPSFNPNSRPDKDTGQFRNRAVTDVFEPGSTIKAFNIAMALESGKYNPNTIIDTRPGWMMVGGHAIHDTADHGIINLTQLLQLSSNVGAAKVMLSLDPQNYWNLLQRVGFGARSQSGFPGESAGRLIFHDRWTPSQTASLAFGYTLSVTALQLADAYSVLADGGVRKPASLIQLTEAPKGQREISQTITNTLTKMMETVVEKGGTGTRAAVPGFAVAGKTGTAYIAGPHGYDKKHYMASFVGFAPAEDPRLVVAVVIKNPKKNHYGGVVAAPAFSKVMSGSLRLMGVVPGSTRNLV